MTTLTYGKFTIDTADVTESGIAYLLQYGFAKSLQDSVAGVKAAMADETDESGEAKYNDAEIAVALHDKQQSRFEAIVAGTVGTRATGPRATPVETMMRNVAKEAIRVACVAQGRKLPKGEAMVALVDKYLSKHMAATRAEAERRIAATAGIDLDIE
jgi:hypothetical protein